MVITMWDSVALIDVLCLAFAGFSWDYVLCPKVTAYFWRTLSSPPDIKIEQVLEEGDGNRHTHYLPYSLRRRRSLQRAHPLRDRSS
ncbi:hypothetical protein CONLIGDRAFT_76315 [Coniochaeta ligniaria NRRL 30616]|uniref:Uncharacterized protein n=1 Tax=Coniochaeta ligniaria NRRL 30616 TaxID=1408157 RepID=A0A1J7ICA9_9PEZI|nr:hypothetical protein CONLIGDRAFT_76315 [Coniochaeta ligniaria NRRL 30616]